MDIDYNQQRSPSPVAGGSEVEAGDGAGLGHGGSIPFWEWALTLFFCCQGRGAVVRVLDEAVCDLTLTSLACAICTFCLGNGCS